MFDVLVIGGGLAGLTSALRLAGLGFKVALVEKQAYPFHRVCGEYISNETLPFLRSLGCEPLDLGAVSIDELCISTPTGKLLNLPLDLGGFGISRYALDLYLFELCQKAGVHCFSKTQVQNVEKGHDYYTITTDSTSWQARCVLGAFGKRANLDNVLKRAFFTQRSPFLGVKYHLRLPTDLQASYPENRITLHNFAYGYAGISRVEGDVYCLCYLTTRQNLKKHQTIEAMEEYVLAQNPHLKKLVGKHATTESLWEKPKVINEISFTPKPLIENGILMVGDSGGMIAPLCGNGMAMAMHGAKLLTDILPAYLRGEIQENTLHTQYTHTWKRQFSRRLWVGRQVQAMFGNNRMTEIFLRIAQNVPPLRSWLVRNSHGKPF